MCFYRILNNRGEDDKSSGRFGVVGLAPCHTLKRLQVRWDDQSQYPEVTIESFVGQSSMGLLSPCTVQKL